MLEHRIRAGEGKLAKSDEQHVSQEHQPDHHHARMHERDCPTPVVKVDREREQDNAGYREAEDHTSSQRGRLFDTSVEQEAEDPVPLKMGRDIKDEANSDHQTVTDNKGNREHLRRGKRSEAFAVERRKQSSRSDDYAQTTKPACGKSVCIVSEQRFYYKPVPCPLKGRVKHQPIQQGEDPRRGYSETTGGSIR